MLIVGIDPGITGAVAVITLSGMAVELEDLPVTQYGKLKWIDASKLHELLTGTRRKYGEELKAYVELTHAMPKFGCIAANAKGLVLGSVLAVLQMAEVPFELIPPNVWKKALNLQAPDLTDAGKKKIALDRARILFPLAELSLQKHHNKAEALLIAHYAKRHEAVGDWR